MVPAVIGYIPEYRGVTGTPRWLMDLIGPKWRRGGAARAGRAPPPPLDQIGQGGGGAPLSFLPSLPSFLLSYLDKERRESYSRWE